MHKAPGLTTYHVRVKGAKGSFTWLLEDSSLLGAISRASTLYSHAAGISFNPSSDRIEAKPYAEMISPTESYSRKDLP